MRFSPQKILRGLFMTAIMALPSISLAAVINGSILEYQDAAGGFVSRSVDFLKFNTAGGVLTFDILASGRPNGLDDSMVWVFKDDGRLDPSDWVAENDDTDFVVDGNGDGSSSELDSFLSIALSPGNYQLAIGSGGDSGGADMIDGLQFESLASSSGQPVASSLPLSYQLTVGGDFNTGAAPVPEPATRCLLASGLAAMGLRSARRKARRAAG